jgi:hypothetical protein
MKKLAVCLAALAASACSLSSDVGTSDDALSVDAPGKNGVRLGVSMKPATDHIPISRDKHKAARVIYSMKVPSLSQGEELHVRADLTITFCDDFDVAGKSSDGTNSPCWALHSIGSYEGKYTPNLATAAVLAKGPSDADGEMITDWQDGPCHAHAHHCSRAIRASVKNPPDSGDRWVNVIAAANDPEARGPDVMNVENNNGGVYVVRLGANRQLPDWHHDQTTNDAHFHVEQSKSGDVAYQIELHDVHPGDIIDAYGAMKVAVPNNPLAPLVKGAIALSNDRRHFQSDQNDVKVFVPHGGTDCTDDSHDGCRLVKAGSTLAPSWAHSTMYVTFVASAECGSEPSGQYDAFVHDGALGAAVWKK